jgi:hypothetical protein
MIPTKIDPLSLVCFTDREVHGNGRAVLALTAHLAAVPKFFLPVFKKTKRIIWSALGRGPFYDASVLHEALSSTFRLNERDAQIKDCQTRIIVSATTLDRYETRSFSNIDRCGVEHGMDGNLFAADVALASAAAPSFFKSHQPKGLDTLRNVTLEERAYTDGGLWANKPVLFAVMTAKRHLGSSFDMRIISLGNRKDGCADPMITAALFSEMIGAGCITKMNRGAIILFPYDCGALG